MLKIIIPSVKFLFRLIVPNTSINVINQPAIYLAQLQHAVKLNILLLGNAQGKARNSNVQ